VSKAKSTITYRNYDPKRLPKEMPPLVPGEAGLCHYEYTLDVAVGTLVDELSPGQVELEVDTVEINASLPITIFSLKNAPKRIMEHEEGHAAISQYYYQNIDVYATRVAKSWLGKKMKGTGKNKQAAIDDANHKIIAEINKQVLDKTRVRAVAANDRYDTATDHSRNPGSQDEAAKKVESQDPEPAGGLPEGSPATAPAK
jgi:hypothetical protein